MFILDVRIPPLCWPLSKSLDSEGVDRSNPEESDFVRRSKCEVRDIVGISLGYRWGIVGISWDIVGISFT